ncbi:DUF2029 domain-containing protein [candidate division KSB1 bacterium]|nr:DUF2029 domain-containing protein [candidate division KSB1 bacterium]NIR70960.1 DUF2029 domain-containing protein [candidate division KSB1 bacterium]NIS24696.1 DUF2029 domain-containing protein [candidate division KSB1 bacterium]NIT71605.1 DUF2029 domain-containing protein [candidate division KSB1 bacterium]NIU25309.1 DUF2029 domain-containing protein [candidate division KSB1 bacterium]
MFSKKVGRTLLWVYLMVFSLIIFRYGVLPTLSNTRGDFANYYTASRLLVDGISLERAYRDFIWFQKQMDRYGIRNQIGGFIPHPPPTALVFLPLVPLDAVTAKNVWTAFNLGLVVLNIFLLSRISGLNWLIAAVLFLSTGYGLLNNFLFGQQYLLVLSSILLAIYFYQRQKPLAAGVALGLMIPIKYVGVLFLFYFIWKKQWRLLVAACATILSVIGLTLFLGEVHAFKSFLAEVLPRHLRGEIQDPFSIYFQSWNSLFRRMFIFEESLNSNPLWSSPLLFFVLKNFVFLLLAAFSIFVLARIRFQNDHHQQFFHFAWIPLATLLLSPGSATYHFLLLTLSVVFLVKILLDLDAVGAAVFLGTLFVVVNLPHYMKLKDAAVGWWTFVGYSRLWLLLLFFVSTVVLFRKCIHWRISHPFAMVMISAVTVLFGFTAVRGYSAHRNERDDGARWLRVVHPEFNRHLGLVLKSPDVGGREVVFSYCELMDEDYAIYSTSGVPWFEAKERNFYSPALAADDSSLLVETIVDGRSEIWLHARGHDQPKLLAHGEHPSWHPDGVQFAFVSGGEIVVSDVHKKSSQILNAGPEPYDPVFSPQGNYLAYCAKEGGGTSLRLYDRRSETEKILLQSDARIEAPQWSSDERVLLFCWDVDQSRDIWALELASGQTHQLTFHRAADDEPVWDERNRRIVFTSDRGRGLECSALYWIPVPEELP